MKTLMGGIPLVNFITSFPPFLELKDHITSHAASKGL